MNTPDLIIGYDGTEEPNPVLFRKDLSYKVIQQFYYNRMLGRKPSYQKGVIEALELHIANKMPIETAARQTGVHYTDVITAKYLYNPEL